MTLNLLSLVCTDAVRQLGNHLWQSTLFACVVGLIALAMRKYQARVRYWLWLTASAKFLVPLALLIALGSHIGKPGHSTKSQAGMYVVVDEMSQPFTAVTAFGALGISAPAPAAGPRIPVPLFPVLLGVTWLCGFIAVLGYWCVQWRRIAKAVKEAEPLLEGREIDALRRVERTLKISRGLAILSSRGSWEPGVAGIVRPVLLWPEGISPNLDDAHLDAVLAHEGCHIQRRDNLTSVVHMLVEAIFWFHPLVWWMEGRLVEERERACDESVLELCSQPEVYAESLVKVCEFCVKPPLPCISGITGADLKRRIGQIMTTSRIQKLGLGAKLLLLGAGAVAVSAPIMLGQMLEARTVAATGMLAQEDKIAMRIRPEGIFGPVTARLKAGDEAPKIECTRVLHALGNAQWNSANTFNETIVLVFLPLVSRNPHSVDLWNGLVDRFATRPVQLVLITQEQESTLLPWLAQHPVNGWLLYDPTGLTGRAYGLEVPNTVYVGTDRKIIAFSHGFMPRDEELNAVLEGRIRTEPVNPDPASLEAFRKSGEVLLQAEPSKMPGFDDPRPKFPPSYEVHITPSTALGTGSTSAPDYWSMSGFALKSIVARAYGVEDTRVDFPDAAAASKRYDVALVLPQAEDRDVMLRRIQDALKEKFKLKIASEDELMDVYVLTAPYGPGPKLRPAEDSMGGSIGSSSMDFSLPEGQQPTPENIKNAMDNLKTSRGVTLGSISVAGGTLEDFCKVLETGLDRKVVDETRLTGRYDFNVVKGDRTLDEFFDMLREQLGLAVTPEKRNVSMLVVRSN